MHGRFIVIDGMDASGKTTQIELLKKNPRYEGVVFTREPGGTLLSEKIRDILLDSTLPEMTSLDQLLLFFAARHAHIFGKIMPALVKGQHVICDRFDSSSFAFQVMASGIPGLEQKFRTLRSWMQEMGVFPGSSKRAGVPDAYIFLDLPASVAYERRRKAASEKHTLFDVKSLEYYEKVRRGFQGFGKIFGGEHERGVTFIHAEQSVEGVQQDLLAELADILGSEYR